MADATNHQTPGYERWPEQKRRWLVTEEYEYDFPFHYANVTVNRRFYRGSEFHGVEMKVTTGSSRTPACRARSSRRRRAAGSR